MCFVFIEKVVEEIEKKWLKPTDGQMQKLQMLQKAPNKMKVTLFFNRLTSSSACMLLCQGAGTYMCLLNADRSLYFCLEKKSRCSSLLSNMDP